jgi:hypothetical protein
VAPSAGAPLKDERRSVRIEGSVVARAGAAARAGVEARVADAVIFFAAGAVTRGGVGAGGGASGAGGVTAAGGSLQGMSCAEAVDASGGECEGQGACGKNKRAANSAGRDARRYLCGIACKQAPTSRSGRVHQVPGAGKLTVWSAVVVPAVRRCTKTGVPAAIT